jgi:hypothetical protein
MTGTSTATVARCPACGAPDDGLASCGSCGLLLRRVGAGAPPPRPRPAAAAVSLPPRVLPAAPGSDAAWPYLVAGLVLAPVLTFTPLLRYVGWFLASLVHESGHCAMSWWLGSPAFPAIRLDGHAAAVHGAQSIPIVVMVWVGTALLAGVAWRHVRVRPVLVAALVLQPLLAFTRHRETAFLVAGHLGEIAFAAVFLWRAITGGFTASRAERGLYATLGFYLVGRNALLSGGLVWSEERRHEYAGNGSFGLENDYVRVARECLGCSTESVAFAMLVVTAAALAASFVLARLFPAPDR